MNEKDKWYYLRLLILSACTSLALTMNFSPVPESAGGLSAIYPDLKNGFGGTSFTSTFLCGLLFAFNYKIDKIKDVKLRLLAPVCFFVSVIWVMGESFHIDNTLFALYGSYVQILKTVIYVIGITYLLMQLAYFFRWILDMTALKGWDVPKREMRLTQTYRKHPFLCPFIILIIGLLPQLILSYPVGMSYDARYQLSQFFGLDTFTSHHPPASTWLMGEIVSFGLLFGNGNIAVFLYIVLQYLLFALITAYLLYTIRAYFQAPRWLQLLTLVVTLVSPYHAAYVGVMLKDILYSYVLLLTIIEVLYMLKRETYFWKSVWHMGMLWISASLTILLRNNGQYVIYPTILALLVFTLREKINKIEKVKFFTLVFLIIILVNSASAYLEINYVEQRGSIREALSLPFQQTARYVKEHEQDVTEQEKEIISKVLDYENLSSLYDPVKSDAVKATYNSTTTKTELKEYLFVWVKQFFRHPMTYIEATVNQNYSLLWPKAEVYNYYTDAIHEDYEPSRELAEFLGLQEVKSPLFQGLATLQALYAGTSLMLPIIGMFSNLAFYNLLLIALLVFAIHDKMKNLILVMVPLLMSDLIIVAAPYVSPRYVLPIIYALPVILALYIEERKG